MTSAVDPTITCPHCAKPIHLTEALARPLVDAKLAAETARIRADVEAATRSTVGAEIESLRSANAAQKSALDAAKRKELELLTKERALAEKSDALDLTVAQTLAAEREKIAAAARAKASTEFGAEIEQLRASIAEQAKKLGVAQAAELALRTDRETFETARREWSLEKERQLEEERKRIRESASREFHESQKLKDAEKDKQLADLRGQIVEWQRKAEQGSQQLQGEVLELDLESNLRLAFPLDVVEPVKKGMRGGDCVQRVTGPNGLAVGSILWESKRTRAWSDGWLEKLREDQREAKAEIAILVTTTMPKDVERFGLKDGVWVTDGASSVALASALRSGLLQLAVARASATGRETKVELLYQYLCGPEFRARVEGIVEAFTTMKADLEAEKRATERQWAKRDKQIERVLRSTSGMYGDLQGIAGSSLPELPSLAGPDERVALADGATP